MTNTPALTPTDNLIRLLEASRDAAKSNLALATEYVRGHLQRHIAAMELQLEVVRTAGEYGRRKP